MVCGLYKYKIDTPTHYVGITGNEYPIDEYINHGRGIPVMGKMDLPIGEYPYTIKYKTEQAWRFCNKCSCDGKTETNE